MNEKDEIFNTFLQNYDSNIPWEPESAVYVIIEPDSMNGLDVIFFQRIDKHINIINFYRSYQESIDELYEKIKLTNYKCKNCFMEKHHNFDMCYSKAIEHGFDLKKIPDCSFAGKIIKILRILPIIHIDNENCFQLINGLKKYRVSYDKYSIFRYYDKNTNIGDAFLNIGIVIHSIMGIV